MRGHTVKRGMALLCAMSLLTSSLLTPEGMSEVQAKSKKPALSKKKISITVGKSAKIKVKNAKGMKIKWKSKNKKIATVKKSGKYAVKIKAKKAGNTKVTATIRKGKKRYTRTCKVKVSTASTGTGKEPTTTGTTSTGTVSTNTPPSGGTSSPQTTEPSETTAAPTATAAATSTTTATAVTTSSSTATATATSAVTATPTPMVSENLVAGSTVKSKDNNVSAKVEGGKAVTEFAGATQYSQATYNLASAVPLSNVLSIQYSLTVKGTPDSVCFKLYNTAGSELSKITNYNKTTGEYKITIPDELKTETVGGYAIMTNSDITGTQTAEATLNSLTFTYSGATPTPPAPTPTRKPVESDNVTLSAASCLGTGAIEGDPTYNDDGSVTVTLTQESGGGGIVFYVDASKTAVDLSGYKEVVFRVTSDVEAPACFNWYKGTGYWTSGVAVALGYSTFSTTEKTYSYSLNGVTGCYGFGVKYNTYGSDLSKIPTKVTITIHSITLVKDSRDITDATTNYSKLSELAAQYGFKMGAVISNTTVNDSKYKGLMKYHFNSLTAANEMKAYSLLDQNGSRSAYANADSMPVLNFANADKIMDFARDNNIRIRGHVLVWDAGMSDWFFREGYDTTKGYASADVIKKRLKNYMEQVLTHFETNYPGVIYCWDVVNEAVGSDGEYKDGDKRHVRTLRDGVKNMFYEIIGEKYVELSFQYAHEIIENLKKSRPNLDIKLFYNDFNTFYDDKRDAICELVKSINSYQSDGKGGYVKLCDGVGMQSYIGGFGQQSGCMNDGDITRVKNAIAKFAGLGVEVQATELAVRNYQGDAATLAKHAEFYKKLFQVYKEANSGSSKPLTAVCIWGIVDNPDMDPSDYSYKMNGTYCGLFDENYGVKPAFVSVHDLLKKG